MLTDQMTKADSEITGQANAPVQGIRLAGLFSDGVVLQRDELIPVWGTAAPRRKIHCCLGDAKAVTYSGNDGEFLLKLPKCPAATNLELIVTDGVSECRVKNVSVGEVFLLSGQSNMEFDLENLKGREQPSTSHIVRIFRVRPQTILGGARSVLGSWKDITERRGCSAIGAFFGAKIAEMWDVPVGLIDTARGGVEAEAYISECELMKIPHFKDILATYEEECFKPENNPESYDEAFTDGNRLLKQIAASQKNMPAFPLPADGWESANFYDADWPVQDLPGSWLEAGHPHAGIFVYRKHIAIPDHWLNKELTLSLGMCDRADVTYFNGWEVGHLGDPALLDNWNTVRVYTIPAEYNITREAVIAVQVAAWCSIATFGGMFGPKESMTLSCGNETMPISGTWKYQERADTGCEPMLRMTATGVGEAKSLHILYDNLIRNVAPFAIRAVLWYQGEANTLSTHAQYYDLLRALIRCWHQLWPQLRLPFLTFQLPGWQQPRDYTAASTWAIVRDAQYKASMDEEGIPPVVTTDVGDIDNIHPLEKRIPGERAALLLDSVLADNGTLYAGAACTFVQRTPTGVELIFNTFGSELADNDDVHGIVGISSNGTAIPVKARVTSANCLTVELPASADISEIAYGWCENPVNCSLKSKNGLPAFPFKLAVPAIR